MIKEAISYLNDYNQKLIDEIGESGKNPLHENYDFLMERNKKFHDDMLSFQHKVANSEIEIIKKIESQLGIKI
jgi:hypothetical protein